MVNRRIKFAYFLEGWIFDGGDRSSLKLNAQKIQPSEYESAMENSIFCPECSTNLIRTPKKKDHFSNNREAYFAHIKK